MPSNFLKGIVTLYFHGMRNLMSVVFRLLKSVVLGTEKVSYHFRKGDKT